MARDSRRFAGPPRSARRSGRRASSGAAREAAASSAADDLREQIGRLSSELATVESELSDLATTRQTLMKLTHDSNAWSTGRS
jgi:hypothetical protein